MSIYYNDSSELACSRGPTMCVPLQFEWAWCSRWLHPVVLALSTLSKIIQGSVWYSVEPQPVGPWFPPSQRPPHHLCVASQTWLIRPTSNKSADLRSAFLLYDQVFSHPGHFKCLVATRQNDWMCSLILETFHWPSAIHQIFIGSSETPRMSGEASSRL